MKNEKYSFETSPLYWVNRLRIRADAALRKSFQERGYDVTPEQWGVLVRLAGDEGMNQCQLGEKSLKDRHNITRILNRLEKKGLIERRKCSDDKRAFRIYLTDEGRKMERNLSALVIGQRKFWYKGVSEGDLLALQETVQRLLGNMEDYLGRKI